MNPKPQILITGGTGLVGSYLRRLIIEEQMPYRIAVLSQRPVTLPHAKTYLWNVEKEEIDPNAIKESDYIIHLAGAGIADKPWTAERKRVILESRTRSTALLYEALKSYPHRVKHFVSASAVGYYGFDTGDRLLHEDSPPGNDFLSQVVVAWEKEIFRIGELVPTAALRIGIVLSNEGGALPQLARPVRWFVGAPLGSGKQYLSWIHIRDLCRLFMYVLENSMEGVFNAVEGKPVTNAEMTRAIARVLGRPLWLPSVPAFVLKTLLGEMANVVLGGNRVSNEKLLQSGFEYEFTNLEEALRDLLK
ncbi:hypothetical protein FHS56_002410 [Thermonema lapsum]|uniref:TIGR01777 family protein n=1 Tax=Thermonema lapsum TaxID=28195 RepID=A0A846MTG4_9BACT|nr:TIGR01777 family oxidoreductase [Thermonema lapsum]NIK74876.1 hypothetical protein [Thermonema lapsum]